MRILIIAGLSLLAAFLLARLLVVALLVFFGRPAP